MPINIFWADDAQTAIVIQPHGKWTWEDFYASAGAGGEGFALLDQADGDHKIHTILDWSKTANWPMNTMVHGKNLLTHQHPQQGAFVFSGMNAVLNGLYRVFLQLNRKALETVTLLTARTVDEALEKLAALP